MDFHYKAYRYIPYSGKLTREKTFANFVDTCPFAKVFFANIACARNHTRCIVGIRESFIRETRMLAVFAKLFSLPRKFPAIRYISHKHNIMGTYAKKPNPAVLWYGVAREKSRNVGLAPASRSICIACRC